MIPIYELVIDKETDGVDLVSFVGSPAMKTNWIAFSEGKKQMFNVISDEKRIVTGAILLADFPVVRVDEQGNPYYVILRKDTIEKTAQKFFREGRHVGSNENHNSESYIPDVYMFESYLVDEKRGMMPPPFLAEVAKDGSWIGSYKIDSDEVWDKVKMGEFNGFSIEGFYGMKPVEFAEANKTSEAEILHSLKNIEKALYKTVHP